MRESFSNPTLLRDLQRPSERDPGSLCSRRFGIDGITICASNSRRIAARIQFRLAGKSRNCAGLSRHDEIEIMKRAAALADLGYQCFVETAAVGMKEYELVAEVEAFLKTHGAEDNFMLIASGGCEVVGMKPPTDRELKRGDSVITELTPQIDGYYAQICRTLVLGKPSAEQRQSFLDFLRGTTCCPEFAETGSDRIGSRPERKTTYSASAVTGNTRGPNTPGCGDIASDFIWTRIPTFLKMSTMP